MSSSTVAGSIIYLGLDVHKDSVTIAVLPADASTPTRIDQYPNDFAKLRRVFERLANDGELRACYEASGAGYVLQRAMQGWGYHCDVIAPSLIPIKPGVQRKYDKYDASQLARLYRAGELTAIRIPSEAEERVRDVVRCRETLQREVVKSRHYILKFLRAPRLCVSRRAALASRALHLAATAHRRDLAARSRGSACLQRVLRAPRQRGQSPTVTRHAWKAQQRLYAMYHRLSLRRGPQIAVVAVARELVGYLWAVMRELDAASTASSPAAA